MKAEEILTENCLNRTAGRLNILNILISNQKALTEKEIQIQSDGICDRATIYRILKKFTDFGIVHSISEGLVTKFILKKYPAEHSHFKCLSCGEITCLPQIQINELQLPQGYTRQEASLIITGKCRNCGLKTA
jgi:Fur family transcriptional regulator, ferric uptake regulator